MNPDRPFGTRTHRVLRLLRHVLLGALILAAMPERSRALEVMYVSNPAVKHVDRFAMDGSSLGSIVVKDYDPFGLAVDSRGGLYVSDARGGRIYRYDSEGNLVSDYDSGLKQSYFLAMDRTDRLFVSNHGDDSTTGSVSVFDRDGKSLFEITENIDNPYGIAFDREGYLYVANYGSSRITRYDADGKYVDGFGLSEGKNPVGLAITPDGRLYVSNTDNDQVNEYDFRGNFQKTLTESLRSPIGLASDEKGNLYAVNKTTDSVSMFDTADEYVPGFAPRGLEAPYAIAIGVPEPSTYVLGGIGAVTAVSLTRRGRGRMVKRDGGKFGSVR